MSIMVDRDQDRHSSDNGQGPDAPRPRGEPDPLAELARLIGQADPFANFGRANPSHPTRRTQPIEPTPQAYSERVRDQAPDVQPSSGPSWMKNRVLQNRPPLPTPSPVEMPAADDDTDINAKPHPLHRYAAQQPPDDEPQNLHSHLPDHQSPPFVADPYPHQHAIHDPHPHEPRYQDDRYDEALYGAVQPTPEERHAQQYGQTSGYGDDVYGYSDEYAEPEARKPRRKGLVTVAAVMALAVVGTGGAYAYRNFVGASRSGEPPVIKADTNPIKVVPPTNATDAANGKLIQDRMAGGGEKLVSREETPVDPRDPSKAGPRVIFPPLNANGNPPSTASVSPAGRAMSVPQAAAGDEPRKIKTFTVKGDQADANGVPVARPATKPLAGAAAKQPPSNANASTNGPMSLNPQSAAPADPRSRVASTNPTQAAPTVSGGYLVQIASQGSEADAQASFKALQGKYPSVLGSRSAQIKRADAGQKGVRYRVMVGPFSSNDEAAQMCGNLKTAGGQCFIQRN